MIAIFTVLGLILTGGGAYARLHAAQFARALTERAEGVGQRGHIEQGLARATIRYRLRDWLLAHAG